MELFKKFQNRHGRESFVLIITEKTHLEHNALVL